MSHVTRTPLQGHFTHRLVNTSGSCSGHRGNVLAVGNYCYVASARRREALWCPQREERGEVISWRPPAYSLLVVCYVLQKYYERI